MNEITVDQVKQTIDEHRIHLYDDAICTTCRRGVRYRFYRQSEFLKDKIYRQLGCDCAWQPPLEFSYDGFAAMLNAQPPSTRQLMWDAFMACAGKSDTLRGGELKPT